MAGTGSIQIRIGDVAVRIHIGELAVAEAIAARYLCFIETTISDLDIYLDIGNSESQSFPIHPEIISRGGVIYMDQAEFSGLIDVDNNTAKLTAGRRYYLEVFDYFLRVVFSILSPAKGGFIFHSAVVRREGRGFVFYGVSGSGKSTVARLSGVNSVLNDDLNYLKKGKDGWYAYSTPFWNSTQAEPRQGFVEIAGLYRLIQDTKVFTRRLPVAIAAAEIIANIPVVSKFPKFGKTIVELAKDLATAVPIYELHFQKNDSFWAVVDESS